LPAPKTSSFRLKMRILGRRPGLFPGGWDQGGVGDFSPTELVKRRMPCGYGTMLVWDSISLMGRWRGLTLLTNREPIHAIRCS
jgi:hypothetical protein